MRPLFATAGLLAGLLATPALAGLIGGTHTLPTHQVALGCKPVPADVQNRLVITNTTASTVNVGTTIYWTWVGPATKTGSFKLTSAMAPGKGTDVPNPPWGTGGTCSAYYNSVLMLPH